MTRVLLLANGLKPSLKLLNKELSQNDQLFALDGAADWLAINSITPDLIIGDFDSINTDSLSKKLHIADQDTNDLDKALNYSLSIGAHQTTILGAFGLRADHFLTNIYVLKKYSYQLTVNMIHDDQIAFMCPSAKIINLDNRLGDWLSLFPLTNQVGPITTTGVRYPLSNEFLSLNSRLGTLNTIIDNRATVFCECSDLLVMLPPNS